MTFDKIWSQACRIFILHALWNAWEATETMFDQGDHSGLRSSFADIALKRISTSLNSASDDEISDASLKTVGRHPRWGLVASHNNQRLCRCNMKNCDAVYQAAILEISAFCQRVQIHCCLHIFSFSQQEVSTRVVRISVPQYVTSSRAVISCVFPKASLKHKQPFLKTPNNYLDVSGANIRFLL